MTTNCCVPMCNSLKKRNPQISFHKFPAISEMIKLKTKFGGYETVSRRKIWINKLKIGKKISPFMRVCSLHFVESDFFRVLRRKNLKISMKLPKVIHGTAAKPSECAASSSRQDRLGLRNKTRNKMKVTPCEELIHNVPNTEVDTLISEKEVVAANALLSLMHGDTSAMNQKTFHDFSVQVNTPDKLTLCHFITSDSSLTTYSNWFK